MKLKTCWEEGLVTAEELTGRRVYILRFHRTDKIPGPVRSSCVVAEDPDSPEGEIKIWTGETLQTDRSPMKRFCKAQDFPGIYWWRAPQDEDPHQVWLYNKNRFLKNADRED